MCASKSKNNSPGLAELRLSYNKIAVIYEEVLPVYNDSLELWYKEKFFLQYMKCKLKIKAHFFDRNIISLKVLKSLMVAFLLTVIGCKDSIKSSEKLEMWYTTPASRWKEALPIGNGRMGTMIAGHVASDTLVINEETIWTGGIHDYINPKAKDYLKEVRQLILDKEFKKAIEVGDKNMIGLPRYPQRYQPLGDIVFEFDHEGTITNYKRSLNLDDALVDVKYQAGGILYERSFFASHPDDVIIMHFSTESKDGLHFKIKHTSKHRSQGKIENNTFRLSGIGTKQGSRGKYGEAQIDPDITFESVIKVLNGGTLIANEDGSINVKGGNQVTLVYTAETNFEAYNDVSGNPKEKCDRIFERLKGKSYKSLLKKHITDFSALFGRVEVDFGDNKSRNVPTNKLIEQAKIKREPLLDVLFYQMGRYMMISGSRSGTQPLNLQGIWNDTMSPPWGCKWTLNINLPMNYWGAETGNLPECHEPLFNLIYDLHKTGTRVAKEHYGCRGFVVHHNTDLWRDAAPVDGANWGLWPFGGAWLSRHLWEHYLYTQDVEFLKRAYPIIKDASLFFFDYLSEGNQGYLVSSPSISFEQHFVTLPDGKEGRLCEGPTMDNQMLRDLFTNCFRAGEILNEDTVFLDSLNLIKNRLKPTTIDTKSGHLMEWAWPAKQKTITGQNASLWGVHPGYEINYIETPELATAAEKTLRYTDANSVKWQSRGSWMSGTKANFWTRLYKGNEAYNEYYKVVEKNLFPNLLVHFFSKQFFMIDGNLGVAASFNEMLVQSHRMTKEGDPIIDILPAMPDVWEDGSIKGICVRGGFELSMSWKAGKLEKLNILSKTGNTSNLIYGDKSLMLKTKPGASYLLNDELELL